VYFPGKPFELNLMFGSKTSLKAGKACQEQTFNLLLRRKLSVFNVAPEVGKTKSNFHRTKRTKFQYMTVYALGVSAFVYI